MGELPSASLPQRTSVDFAAPIACRPGCAERVYRNAGNLPLRSLIEFMSVGVALDCGCGAGDNARLLTDLGWKVVGVTISPEERELASRYCQEVLVADLEQGIPAAVGRSFDLILFSHVLEHLRNPDLVLQNARSALAPHGYAAVALPNVLYWRQRLRFLAGSFEYEEGGIMDNTHLKFYTFSSGRRLLEANGFRIVRAEAQAIFPLRPVRRLWPLMAKRVDDFAGRLLPGLFAYQNLYLAESS